MNARATPIARWIHADTQGRLAHFVRSLESQSPSPADTLQPDFSLGTPEDLLAAQEIWAWRIVDEYRSAMRFTQLLGLLTEIQAPFETLATVHRLVGDELRHARLCARLSACFGPIEKLQIELDGLGWPTSESTPSELALEIVVRELIIGEGESLACLRAYHRAATDPASVRVLEILLEDEARHFAAGRELETVLLEEFPSLQAFHTALEPTLLQDVMAIRADHRSGAIDGPGRAFGVSIRIEEAPPAIELPVDPAQ